MKNKNIIKMQSECCENHKRNHGLGLLLLGLTIMANQIWSIISWWTLAGTVIAVWGAYKLLMPIESCK